MGEFMQNNFSAWGNRRKAELYASNMPMDACNEECRKIDERLQRYKDKMAFVEGLKKGKKNGQHDL